jgi:hypothetical protein
MGTLRQAPLQDAGERSEVSLPDYVMPEPAVQGTSPSRVVLAVIGIPGGFHD